MSEGCYFVWDIILSALSILATVALSIIAVWQNKRYKKLSDVKDEEHFKEEKERNRLRIRPRLFIEYNNDSYKEIIDKQHILIEDLDEGTSDGFDIKTSAPDDIKQEVLGKNAIKSGLLALKNIERFFLLTFRISNVGAGNAVDIELTINSRRTLPPFYLVVGDSKTIYVLFDFISVPPFNSKTIRLNLKYKDIENAEWYQQDFKVVLREKKGAGETREFVSSSFCDTSEPSFIKS